MQTLWQDFRYGLRGMMRSPGLTAIAVLSLALGIGANTAIFSLVEAVILRSLPVHDPKALVMLGPGLDTGNNDGFPDGDMDLFSYSIYRTMQQKCSVFSGVAASGSFYHAEHVLVGGGATLEPANVELVSGTYFNVLGVKPVVGRVFTDADDRVLGQEPVAVASYGWWTRRFGRNPAAVGSSIRIGDAMYTIVGVAPQGFQGTTVGDAPDLWVPLQMADAISRGPHKLNDKFYRWLNIFARLKPGVTRSQAQANVNVVLKDILADYAGPNPSPVHRDDIRKAHIRIFSAAAGRSTLRSQWAEPLWMLLGIVGLVLLIACANIANLLLARGTMRRRELAMRMALGASRWRLIRQLLIEAVTMAVFGGVLGFLFAGWAIQVLLRMASAGPDLPINVSPDSRVLAFTFLVTLVTAALFGALPAMRATRVDPKSSLGEGRSAVSRQTRSPLGKILIVGQVALSLVLLVGAGLFTRSLVKLMNVNTGFRPRNLLEVRVDSSATGYTDDAQLCRLYQRVEQQIDRAPGVQTSSFAIFTFGGGGWDDSVRALGEKAASVGDKDSNFNAVGPGYFAAMGLPILSGRDFGSGDTATSPRVAIINQKLADQLFPGESPLGKQFQMGGSAASEIVQVVGVVPNAKYQDIAEPATAMTYFPYTQYQPSWGIGLYLGRLVVRYTGDPNLVVSQVREAAAEAGAPLPVDRVVSMKEKIADNVADPRVVAQLSSFFGVLAVFLACLGIYGLMSYAVGRRTGEIGVRMALGAQQRDVLGMILREVVVLVGLGLVIGIPAALAGGRLAANLLFRVKPTDPLTLAVALVLLLLVAVFAGYLPARRASRVDPMTALRYE